MFEGVDAERASSIVVLLLALVLVAGILAESTEIHPDGQTLAAGAAGLLIILYALFGTVYMLFRGPA